MDTQSPKRKHHRRALAALLGLSLAALAAYLAEESWPHGHHGSGLRDLVWGEAGPGGGGAPLGDGGHLGGRGSGHSGVRLAFNGGSPDAGDIMPNGDDAFGDAGFPGDRDHDGPGLTPDGANGLVTLVDFTDPPGDGGGLPGGVPGDDGTQVGSNGPGDAGGPGGFGVPGGGGGGGFGGPSGGTGGPGGGVGGSDPNRGPEPGVGPGDSGCLIALSCGTPGGDPGGSPGGNPPGTPPTNFDPPGGPNGGPGGGPNGGSGGGDGPKGPTINPGDSIGGGPEGVPEPAIWISMILGFGLAGQALRSRRRAARV